MKFILPVLLLLNCFTSAFSQPSMRSDVPVPRAEMRAAWISSVSNLDWPRPEDRGNPQAQKESLIEYLDHLESINMNAAFLQVRSEGDAMYDSPYEPWSRYLGGAQGTDPGYDPIKFAIEEAHKRGIELHAWLNPYRLNASKGAGDSYFHEKHIYKEHPEWAIEYNDGGKILNPGLPEVQHYLKIIVGDLINKYDLDGIHFDDYFYAYGGTPNALDAEAYETYGSEYDNVGDFRRASINKMIANVWDTIQSVRPFIRFGVSPFGIYGNGMNPPGISGLDAYNSIYCDPLAWLEQGTVDYITPQLYWPTGGAQDYGTLVPWWAEWVETYDRHLYPGHGIYRLTDNPATARTNDTYDDLHENKGYFDIEDSNARLQAGWTLDQVATQVEINRQSAELGVLGSVYFRMYDFYRVSGLSDYLKNEVYFDKVLFPEMTWKSSETPQAPSNLRLEQVQGEAFFSLAWDHEKDSIRYVIYTFSPDEAVEEYTSNENRLAITYNKSLNLSKFDIPIGNKIVVTALNRYGVESGASLLFEANTPDQVVLIAPADESENVTSSAELSWHSAGFASTYLLELAADASFTTDYQSFSLEDTTVFIEELGLEGETQFYWRVAGENIGGTGSFSEVYSFKTGYPISVELLKPENGAQNVSLQPEITWNSSEGSESIEIQISEGGSAFDPTKLVVNEIVANTGSYTPEEPLRTLYTHYIRIRGINEYGKTAWTAISNFKTLMPTPDPPAITSPENNAIGIEAPVSITWEPVQGATSYFIQVSDDDEFNNLIVDQAVYGSTQFSLTTLELATTYRVRISSRNAGGLGDWSDVLTFTTKEPVTSVDKIQELSLFLYPNPGNGKFYITGFENGEKVILRATDIIGKQVFYKKTEVSEQGLSIDMEGISCEPCVLKVESKAGVKAFKVFSY